VTNFPFKQGSESKA